MAQPASAYITQCRKTSLDKEAILHKRRKRALAALLSTFEKEIEPLIAAGNDKAIDTFKGDCRKKLNGIAWEAIELAKWVPTNT